MLSDGAAVGGAAVGGSAVGGSAVGGSAGEAPGVEGLVVVDKPGGMTSHDVVARLRRLARTRRVGHAGTLDPAATGVLVVGIGRATRLLGHLALTEKSYDAVIRLGASTTTDDAEGELLATSDAGWTRADVERALAALTGTIMQVPSSVSAVKVGGVRSYARVRAGEDVVLAPRPVTVSQLALRKVRPDGDLDVTVTCSSGTYVRALARDLGASLGTGGHLRALRRTRVGPYDLRRARTLPELADHLSVVPLHVAVADAFPRRDVDADAARDLSHGRPLAATGVAGPVGVFDPDGAVLALVEDRDGAARPLVVLAPA